MILNCIVDNYDKTMGFIFGFIDHNIEVASFISSLTDKWPSIWSHVSTHKDVTNENKNELFTLICNHASIDAIKVISKNSDFREVCCNTENFLQIIKNEQSAKAIISALDIKFNILDFEKSPKSLLEYIYISNHYALNISMLENILRYKGKYTETTFQQQNYTAIQETECQELIDYIESSIVQYINHVYLKISDNGHDQEVIYIQLLNKEAIPIEVREKIILHAKIKVTKLKEINDSKIISALLMNAKTEATWSNLHFYSRSEGFSSDTLATFLNTENVYHALSVLPIPQDDASLPTDDVYDIFMNLLQNEKLSDESLMELLKPFPKKFFLPEGLKITKERISILVEHDLLEDDDANYKFLSEDHINLFVKFWIKVVDSRIRLEPYPLKLTHLQAILALGAERDDIKKYAITHADRELYKNDGTTLSKIASLVEQDDQMYLSDELVLPILNAKQSQKNRISLLARFGEHLVYDETSEILKKAGDPYEEITIRSKDVRLEKTDLHFKLLETLKKMNYIQKFKTTGKNYTIPASDLRTEGEDNNTEN